MDLVIFMIHLCTIATLMFVQNNTSQKILFIAARTIQFPGVVFKVCIYLIVCHRHLKYIFRCQKYPYLSKIYISAIYFSMMERFRGVGDKEYTLTALKLMTATDAFLGRDERFRGCSLTSFEECYAEMFLKEVVQRCHIAFHGVCPLFSMIRSKH